MCRLSLYYASITTTFSYLFLVSSSLSGGLRLTSIHCGVVILTPIVVSTHICLKSAQSEPLHI